MPKFRTILYATDYPPGPSSAFRYALSLARQFDATVTIVHAMEPLGTTARHLLDSCLEAEVRERLHAEGFSRVRDTIRKTIETLCAGETEQDPRGSERVSEIHVEDGFAADVVVREADRIGADLIVMGTHRHSAVGEVLLGTAAHRVIQLSQVPVLLVRSE